MTGAFVIRGAGSHYADQAPCFYLPRIGRVAALGKAAGDVQP
ncbi:hypothetical protein Z947_2909 [Sulfitobacter geojensis]|nr:hypothetical protein Z947_2909 [Sulfitobacter geojensis]